MTASTAEFVATALRLPQGFWSVVTAIVIMQSSLGGTVGAGADRVAGTIAGAAFGTLGALIEVAHPLPSALVLAFVIAPAALVAALRPSLRVAPLTAAIVVLAGSGGEVTLRTALTRTLEILIGTLVGIACAYFVFPTRAIELIRLRGGDLLEVLGELVEARLIRAPNAQTRALTARVRSLLAALELALSDSAYERRVRLSTTSPALFVDALRRLRSDVALLGSTAVAAEGVAEALHVELARAFRAYLAAAGAHVRDGSPAPRSEPLQALLTQLPAGRALALALGVLASDLALLPEAIEEVQSLHA